MLNFEFHNATKVIFGRETEHRVGEEMRKIGKKILLHYGGGSIKQTGLYDRVMDSLQAAGLEVLELGGVAPNPRLDLVLEGIELCRRESIEAILAVGGGSAIDSAKAIALGVPYEGDVWDFYCGKMEATAALPTGVILTLPAAGSETSRNSVVSDTATGMKRGAKSLLSRPVFCILNPELSYTLPAYQTASGAVDMLAHVMERYFSTVKEGDLTDRLCEATMQSIIKNAPLALENPTAYAPRAELMWAGTLAHNDLLDTGRIGEWSAHQIEHELSAMYDVAHGAGLAVIFPAWMKYSLHCDVMRFAQFGHRVFGVPMDFQNPEYTALEGIAQLEAWCRRLGMPTRLKDMDIGEEHLAFMAQNCRRSNPEKGTQGNLNPLNTEDILNIYKLALK